MVLRFILIVASIIASMLGFLLAAGVKIILDHEYAGWAPKLARAIVRTSNRIHRERSDEWDCELRAIQLASPPDTGLVFAVTCLLSSVRLAVSRAFGHPSIRSSEPISNELRITETATPSLLIAQLFVDADSQIELLEAMASEAHDYVLRKELLIQSFQIRKERAEGRFRPTPPPANVGRLVRTPDGGARRSFYNPDANLMARKNIHSESKSSKTA